MLLLLLILTKHRYPTFLQEKYTFSFKGTKNVPIKGIDDKRQITATFAVSLTGKFLPIQLIYKGKTKRSLPKFKFPSTFSLSYTENHWSNTEKSIGIFEQIIFPYLKMVKRENGYLEEQVHSHNHGHFQRSG